MNLLVGARAAPVSAIRQLTNCAARMPITMVSWLIATSRPRICAGAISAMYIGREVRGQADGHAAQHAPDHEDGEGLRQPVADRGDGEQERGQDEQPLASELVAQRAGHQRAEEAADQGATVGPAFCAASVSAKKRSKKGLAPPITTQS